MRYVILPEKRGGERSLGLLLPHVSFDVQFRDGSPYRRLGLLNGNRFGEYFFDDVHQLATKAVREEGKASLEQRAITTGKPLVEVEREVNYTFQSAKSYDRPQQSHGQNTKRNNNREFTISLKKKKKTFGKCTVRKYLLWFMRALQATTTRGSSSRETGRAPSRAEAAGKATRTRTSLAGNRIKANNVRRSTGRTSLSSTVLRPNKKGGSSPASRAAPRAVEAINSR
jgi:hypothetical protein